MFIGYLNPRLVRTLLLIFGIMPYWLVAQSQFLGIPVDQAKELAKTQGSFILLDFYASWCGPCVTMDERVWSQPSVAAAQRGFVNVRVDATHDQNILRQYGLQGIPALIILDANGEEYFRKVGYAEPGEIIGVLNNYPSSMQLPYAADALVAKQPDLFNPHLLRSLHYQNAARESAGGVQAQLVRVSDEAAKVALDILAEKQYPPESLIERIELMQAENLLLRGRAKKAVKVLEAMAATGHEKNEALACYLRGLAYTRTGQPELAEACYSALEVAVNNEAYLQRLSEEMELASKD